VPAPIAFVPRALAHRVKRALGNATLGDSGVDDAGWRRGRDALLDLLEPVQDSRLSPGQLRELVDLLSEASPSTASRMSQTQWRSEVDALVAELLTVRAR
jgi:hypothetical protein